MNRKTCLVWATLACAAAAICTDARGGTDAGATQRPRQSAERSRDPLRLGAEFPEAAAEPVSRRRHRRRHQFQGTHLRLHAQPGHAPLRIRCQRQLRPRNRRRTLRLRLRPRRARRSAGQHLGRRRRLEHGHQVQSRRPRRHGAGPKAGARSKAAPPTAAREPYRLRPPHRRRLGRRGQIFVSDGYGNSRVVKYDKNGRFIAAVGTKGSAPGQLNLPHTIATDAKGNVYVGDRSNSRIQVFDNDLTFKADLRPGRRALGRLHLARPASVSLQLQLESRQQQFARSPPSPARSTRWSWTAPSSASSETPASSSASSAPSTKSIAATRTSSWCPKSPPGACRKLIPAPRKEGAMSNPIRNSRRPRRRLHACRRRSHARDRLRFRCRIR